MKLVVGMTGASGSIYGVRMMEILHDSFANVETHFVISKAGLRVLKHETELTDKDVSKYAFVTHSDTNIGAVPASGSSGMDAMVIIPCSVKTLGQIACGTGDNLICRSADVFLKENKKLILVIREMPLSAIHLENMLKLSRLGVSIIPASPGFYHEPKKMDDLINHVVGKTLDALGLEHDIFKRWTGQKKQD
ncbi:MAG: UbiX family flavin prenyltransferase [Nitrospinota bacterium]|nr:UbiX family flavin prenyltransferase [Nitrospinota bacterium]